MKHQPLQVAGRTTRSKAAQMEDSIIVDDDCRSDSSLEYERDSPSPAKLQDILDHVLGGKSTNEFVPSVSPVGYHGPDVNSMTPQVGIIGDGRIKTPLLHTSPWRSLFDRRRHMIKALAFLSLAPLLVKVFVYLR